MRWHLCPQVHAAGVLILTAKPVRRSRRKGPAAGTRPGRSRCRRRPGPGSGPETGAGPGLSACPAPGRRPCPRTPRQSRPPRPRPPRRSSKRLPETSVSLPGITLSDEGGQGERARSRRSYLESESGCLRCKRRGCFVCISCVVDALPGQCLRRRPGTNPLVAAVFRTKRL